MAGREASRLGHHARSRRRAGAVAQVGERQQRLLRELEKLALEHGDGAHVGAEEVEAARGAVGRAAGLERSSTPWSAATARRATRAFLELRAPGETLPRLVPLMARRLRDVLAIAGRLEAGESPAQVKSSLRMSPWAADRRIKEARGDRRRGAAARARGAQQPRARQPGPQRIGRRHGGAAGDRGHRGVDASVARAPSRGAAAAFSARKPRADSAGRSVPDAGPLGYCRGGS